MKSVAIYGLVLAALLAAFFLISAVYLPAGINETNIGVDYTKAALLPIGIFTGAVCSQIYDRYVKHRTINAARADFLIGALASAILTAFLFEELSEIDSNQVVFFLAFQNGFLFTTVIEKLQAKSKGGKDA